jgi:hypothetical protein
LKTSPQWMRKKENGLLTSLAPSSSMTEWYNVRLAHFSKFHLHFAPSLLPCLIRMPVLEQQPGIPLYLLHHHFSPLLLLCSSAVNTFCHAIPWTTQWHFSL